MAPPGAATCAVCKRSPASTRVDHQSPGQVLSLIHIYPHHHARVALDDLLTQLADDLQHDPETMERAERIKVRVLDHPQLLETATSLWAAFRTALITSLGESDSPLRRRIEGQLRSFAEHVRDDEGLRLSLIQI